MADKSVERCEPPFKDYAALPPGEDGKQHPDIAYVMVYTHLDDTIESIAFNATGAEVGWADGDFRRTAKKAASPSPAPEPLSKPSTPPLAAPVSRPRKGDGD